MLTSDYACKYPLKLNSTKTKRKEENSFSFWKRSELPCRDISAADSSLDVMLKSFVYNPVIKIPNMGIGFSSGSAWV